MTRATTSRSRRRRCRARGRRSGADRAPPSRSPRPRGRHTCRAWRRRPRAGRPRRPMPSAISTVRRQRDPEEVLCDRIGLRRSRRGRSGSAGAAAAGTRALTIAAGDHHVRAAGQIGKCAAPLAVAGAERPRDERPDGDHQPTLIETVRNSTIVASPTPAVSRGSPSQEM